MSNVYLFGDSTPSALPPNVLELVVALTESAACLLEVGHAVRSLAEELSRCQLHHDLAERWLEQSVEAAREALCAKTPPAECATDLRAEAGRLGEALAAALGESIARQSAGNERRAAALQSEIQTRLALIQAAVGPILALQELPGAVWGVEWRQPCGPETLPSAEAVVVMDCGLEASFELDALGDDLWRHAPRVQDFAPLILDLPMKRGLWRSGSALRRVRLDNFHIVGASCGPTMRRVLLAQDLKPGSTCFQIRAEVDGPLVVTVDALQHDLEAADEQSDSVRDLLAQITASLRALALRGSRRMLSCCFQGAALSSAEQAERCGAALIAISAPIVRQLREHAVNDNELGIKRELGDCRREEIFLPLSELTSRIERLPPPARAPFSAYALQVENAEPPRRTTRRDITQNRMLRSVGSSR